MIILNLAMIFASLPAVVLPQPALLEVDCSAGQSLERALLQVQKSPGGTIRVRGTCVGNFLLTTDSVRIEGVSETESILKAPTPDGGEPVLTVRDARNVSIIRMGIQQGSIGAYFLRSPQGYVIESTFENNGVGLVFDQSEAGSLSGSTLRNNDFGLISDARSDVAVIKCSFFGNRIEGLSAFDYSTLAVSDTEVAGSGQAGISARSVSRVNLVNCSFHNNGDVHVFASDGSRFQLVSGLLLGAEGDPTPFATGIDDGSALYSGTQADFRGYVFSSGNSYLELGSVSVHGMIWAQEFSRVVLFQTRVSDPVICDSGADLACVGSTNAEAFGCFSSTTCISKEFHPNPRKSPPPSLLPEILQRARPPYKK